jgi:acetyl esterase/lipase
MTRLQRLFSFESRPKAALLVQPVHAAGLSGDWLTRPGDQGRHCLLYLHDGAAAVGLRRALAGRLALAAGIPTLLLDYRQPPSHPRSAAVRDAVAAWRSLLSRGFDASNIVVAGHAAGSGPAADMLEALRESGLPSPGLTCLLGTPTDAELGRAARAIRSWKGGG